MPPEELEAAAQLLTVHIGLVARIVVTRVAAANLQRAELYRRLADEIESEDDRAEFLREAGILF